jgi:hypothetical protein
MTLILINKQGPRESQKCKLARCSGSDAYAAGRAAAPYHTCCVVHCCQHLSQLRGQQLQRNNLQQHSSSSKYDG